MITFISFLVTLFGCVNWMSIGMLQYDIVAGFFGTQSNIFSRIIYIVIGFAALWMIISAIKQRGKINIFKNKREVAPVQNQQYEDRYSRHDDKEFERTKR